jgi:hypothetical protein
MVNASIFNECFEVKGLILLTSATNVTGCRFFFETPSTSHICFVVILAKIAKKFLLDG